MNYVRLATAIAIIRSKPKHVSAQSYAEKLQSDLKSLQLDWKQQYEQMKEELLAIKQKKMILELESK